MRTDVSFSLVVVLAAVSLGQSQVQPKAGAAEKQQGSAASQDSAAYSLAEFSAWSFPRCRSSRSAGSQLPERLSRRRED